MADDTTPPTLSITRIGGEFAEVGAPVRFALTFSEPVTGVTAAALRLTASATLKGAAITSVTGSGADYVVTVGPATAGYGTVSLDVLSAGVADLAGNPLKFARQFIATPAIGISNAAYFTAADVNSDGRADLIAGSFDWGLSVALANPDGSLRFAPRMTVEGFNLSPTVADFNGDGEADIVTSNGSNAVNVVLGRGDGTFGAPIPATTGANPTSLAVGDIDRDGKLDIVTNITITPESGNVSVLRGTGDGSFATFQTVNIGFLTGIVNLADMNGDGRLDLMVFERGFLSSDDFAVLLGDGVGGFGVPTRINVVPNFRSESDGNVQVGDVSGDGKADIVFSDDGGVLTYVNKGDATFQTKRSPAGTGRLNELVDMNGDGKLDAVTVSFNDTLRQNEYALWEGLGDGTFAAPSPLIDLAEASAVAFADFNGDGANDVVHSPFVNNSRLGLTTQIATDGAVQPGPTLKVDDLAGDGSTSGRITPGQSVAGFIGGASDRDWFRTELVAGQTYVFDLQGFRSGNGSLNNALLILRNAAGDTLTSSFSASELQEPQITFTPTTSATYFLEAASSATGGGGGSYRLNATRIATKQADFSDAADIVTLRSPIAAVPVQVWSALGGEDGVTGGKSTSDTINGNAGNDTLSGGDVGLTLAGEGVFQAYQLFGRSPDADGFAYMVKNAGSAIGGVSQSFEGSAEFAAIYNGLNNADFITKLYITALARTPTATELAGWDARFAGSASRAIIASEFVGLPELETRTQYAQAEFAASLDKANFGALHRLYATAFGRTAEQGGFADWTGRRDAGQTIGDVALGFANSDEFGAATKGLTNAQIVTKLYQNALGRAPDAGGLADWVAQLDAGPKTGALLAKVLLGFSESAEFKALQPTAPAAFVSSVLTQWTDVLDGGAGDDVLIGGRGSDTFRFLKGETGSDRIIAFESWDSLAFTNFGYASGATALARMAQVGADVVFSDEGSSITFVNTALATVSAANFIVGEIL